MKTPRVKLTWNWLDSEGKLTDKDHSEVCYREEVDESIELTEVPYGYCFLWTEEGYDV